MTGPADVPSAFQCTWNAHDMAAFGARIQAAENVTLSNPMTGAAVLRS